MATPLLTIHAAGGRILDLPHSCGRLGRIVSRASAKVECNQNVKRLRRLLDARVARINDADVPVVRLSDEDGEVLLDGTDDADLSANAVLIASVLMQTAVPQLN